MVTWTTFYTINSCHITFTLDGNALSLKNNSFQSLAHIYPHRTKDDDNRALTASSTLIARKNDDPHPLNPYQHNLAHPFFDRCTPTVHECREQYTWYNDHVLRSPASSHPSHPIPITRLSRQRTPRAHLQPPTHRLTSWPPLELLVSPPTSL